MQTQNESVKLSLDLALRFAAREASAREVSFVAPRVFGGQVRLVVDGLVVCYRPIPRTFTGFGLFVAGADGRARLVGRASRRARAAWLARHRPVRLIAIEALDDHGTWLALPAHAEVFERHVGAARPVAVHLARDLAPLDALQARFDGRAFWYEGADRRVSPRRAERLRAALRAGDPPEALRLPGLTPEQRGAYGLARAARADAKARAERARQRGAQARLAAALHQGGGRLEGFDDRGDHWLVRWVGRHGEVMASAIAKADLTVMSAGLCLDGLDRDFDLQSLVGVVADADPY